MNREYQKGYSQELNADMEALIFGMRDAARGLPDFHGKIF